MNKALVKWTFTSLIIVFLFSSCKKKVQDNYHPKHTAEYLSKQLETAYKEKDSIIINPAIKVDCYATFIAGLIIN